MTRSRLSAVRSAALCAAVLVGVTACGSSSSGSSDSTSASGTTSAQAGTRLSHDAHGLLGDMQKLLKAPAPYTVSADSVSATGATACGKGKERRSFAGQMQVPATPTARQAMILDSGSANGYLVQQGYSPDKHAPRTQSDSRRSDVMVNEKAAVTITVVLTPAPGGALLDYKVTGTTDCLRAS